MYTLRIPFELPDGQALKCTDQYVSRNGLEFKFRLEQHSYVMIVKGFKTPNEAKTFFATSWVGFRALLIEKGIAPIRDRDLAPVFTRGNTRSASPQIKNILDSDHAKLEVDGLIDGHRPSIFETEANILSSLTGRPTVTVTTTEAIVLDCFDQVALVAESGLDGCDPKLDTALDLYSSLFWEKSAISRFLTLMMALEILAEPRLKSNEYIESAERAISAVRSIAETSVAGAAQKAALDTIVDGISKSKQLSYSERIRALVQSTYSDSRGPEAQATASRAAKLFQIRSKLVHSGKLDVDNPGSVITEAREIFVRVARHRLYELGIDLK